MAEFLDRVRAIETAASAAATPIGGFWRYGVIMSVDHENWQVAVRIGSDDYLTVNVAQHVREDLLAINVLVLVFIPILNNCQGALVMATYGARPPMDPRFDNVRGHGHKEGVAGDGAPIRSEDIVT